MNGILTDSRPLFSGVVRVTGGSHADFPSPRTGMVAGFIDGRLYTANGYAGFYSAGTYVWDPDADAWSNLVDAPVARGFATGGVIGGLLYVVGGTSSAYHNENAVYDPVTGTWTLKAPIPHPGGIRNGAGVVLDGLLYHIGGYDSVADQAAVYVYDPEANTWSTRADAPWAAEAGRAVTLDGLVYYMGGVGGGARRSDCAAYDPATDTWTLKAAMPTARSHFMVGILDDRVHALGGRIDAAGSSGAVHEVFLPRENRWVSRDPMPLDIDSAGYATDGQGRLFLVSGWSTSLGARVADVRSYVGYAPVLRLGQSRTVQVRRVRSEVPSLLVSRTLRQAARAGQLFSGQAGEELLAVPEGGGEYGFASVELEVDLVWGGAAPGVRVEGRPARPVSVEGQATSVQATSAFGGVVDTIVNDGAEDLLVSFDLGATWHTVRPGEAWSPALEVFAATLSYRTSVNPVDFRAWGWS